MPSAYDASHYVDVSDIFRRHADASPPLMPLDAATPPLPAMLPLIR